MLRGCAASSRFAAGQTIIILLRLKICEHNSRIHIPYFVYGIYGFNCFSVGDLSGISSCFRVSLDESVEFIRLRSRHMTTRTESQELPAYIINGNPKGANGRLRVASSGAHLST